MDRNETLLTPRARFKDENYCSIQIVNSIGNVFNRFTDPEARLRILKDQISALNELDAGFPLEIVLLDDNSEGDTVRYLFEAYLNGMVTMLFLNGAGKLGNGFTKNMGLSLLRNNVESKSYLPRTAISYGQTGEQSYNPRYVILAENDVIPRRDGWLSDLIDVIENNREIGFINSIIDDFDEEDFHKVLRTGSYKNYTIEYRRLIPGSFYFTKSNYLLKVGAHSVWDLSVAGSITGYDYLANLPEEYRPRRYNGSWDEEMSLRFAESGLFGVNVLPPLLEHRKISAETARTPRTIASLLRVLARRARARVRS